MMAGDADAAIHHACQSSWKGSIASAPLQATRSPPPPPLAAACRPQSSSCESHSLASLDSLLQRASPRTCRARRFEGWDALSRSANEPSLCGGVVGLAVDGSADVGLAVVVGLAVDGSAVSWLRMMFAWLQVSGPDGVFKTFMDLRGRLEGLSLHLKVSSWADALSE